jgi:hypothetical protein
MAAYRVKTHRDLVYEIHEELVLSGFTVGGSSKKPRLPGLVISLELSYSLETTTKQGSGSL